MHHESPSRAVVTAFAAPRFDVADEHGLLSHLDEYGYVVIADVSTAAENIAAIDRFWAHLLDKSPQLDRHCPDTWQEPAWLPSRDNGIWGSHGANHSEFCWTTRLLPRVRQAFACVWDTEDLIVSFDAANAFRPWKRNCEWLTSVRFFSLAAFSPALMEVTQVDHAGIESR